MQETVLTTECKPDSGSDCRDMNSLDKIFKSRQDAYIGSDVGMTAKDQTQKILSFLPWATRNEREHRGEMARG